MLHVDTSSFSGYKRIAMLPVAAIIARYSARKIPAKFQKKYQKNTRKRRAFMDSSR
jgi:DNA primase